MGKWVLADLDKGALSLPIIYLTQALSAKERRRLFAPLRRRSRDPAFIARLAKAAVATGSVARAQARAQAFIEAGRGAIAATRMNGLSDAYEQLAAYALSRRS
jgi:geranylgeranyl pyrophosphate synthase